MSDGDLQSVINSLRAEIAVLSQEVERLTAENAAFATVASDRKIIESLSDRERQIMLRIGAGLTTKEVATELHLSTSTVETYRERIKTKLALKSGVQLTRFAIIYSLQQPTG